MQCSCGQGSGCDESGKVYKGQVESLVCQAEKQALQRGSNHEGPAQRPAHSRGSPAFGDELVLR